MTPKQKKQHIAEIKAIIEKHRFTLDRYGNYKTACQGFRIKLKKINIRFERKSGKQWFKIFSYPIIKIDIDGFNSFLEKRLKQDY